MIAPVPVHCFSITFLISFVVTAKLICAFVFANAKSRFYHDAAHIKQSTKSTKKGFPIIVKVELVSVFLFFCFVFCVGHFHGLNCASLQTSFLNETCREKFFFWGFDQQEPFCIVTRDGKRFKISTR